MNINLANIKALQFINQQVQVCCIRTTFVPCCNGWKYMHQGLYLLITYFPSLFFIYITRAPDVLSRRPSAYIPSLIHQPPRSLEIQLLAEWLSEQHRGARFSIDHLIFFDHSRSPNWALSRQHTSFTRLFSTLARTSPPWRSPCSPTLPERFSSHVNTPGNTKNIWREICVNLNRNFALHSNTKISCAFNVLRCNHLVSYVRCQFCLCLSAQYPVVQLRWLTRHRTFYSLLVYNQTHSRPHFNEWLATKVLSWVDPLNNKKPF